jgi:anti-sigma factor RsiW
MTCEGFEGLLALHVEGDLTVREAARVRGHLTGCERCRAFLAGLERSQGRLKALAAEPVDEGALRTLRERVLTSVQGTRPAHRTAPAWGWALAASLVVLVVGGVRLWKASTTPARGAPTQAAVANATPRPGPAAAPAASAPRTARRSTPRPSPPVSTNRDDGPGERLSPEDADQLARAVVAVAAVGTLTDGAEVEPRTPDAPRGTLVRIATDDPNVVIYWLLEPSGG